MPKDLIWLLLEAGVALGLLLGIVWWTWPRGERRRGSHAADAPEEDGKS